MGFDLYEQLLETQSLAEVMKFAASRVQNDALGSECPVSSAPTEPVPYSPYERGTSSIPISVDIARSA